MTIEATPAFLGGLGELEDHGERGSGGLSGQRDSTAQLAQAMACIGPEPDWVDLALPFPLQGCLSNKTGADCGPGLPSLDPALMAYSDIRSAGQLQASGPQLVGPRGCA